MDTNSRPTVRSLLYTVAAKKLQDSVDSGCGFFSVTSAKSKPCSFSQVRRRKIYMRSTMDEDSLLGLL